MTSQQSQCLGWQIQWIASQMTPESQTSGYIHSAITSMSVGRAVSVSRQQIYGTESPIFMLLAPKRITDVIPSKEKYEHNKKRR